MNKKYSILKSLVFTFIICIVLIDLLAYCKRKKDEYPKELTQAIDLFYEENKNDSVLLLLNNMELSKSDKDRHGDLKSLFIAGALSESSKIDSARTVFNTIVPLKKNEKFMYQYLLIDGLISFRENNSKIAYEKLLQLINEETQDLRALALSQRLIGRIVKGYTDHKSAIEWTFQSIQNFEKAGYEKSAAISKKFMGVSCIKLNHFEDAKNYLDKAKASFEKYNDQAEMFFLYIVLIDYYTKLNKLDSAAIQARNALNTNEVTHNSQMKAHLYNNLGEIAMMQNNYPEALKMFQNTLDIQSDYYGKNSRNRFAYFCLGKIYNSINQPEEAKKYLQLAQEISSSANQIKYEIYQEMAKMYAPSDYRQSMAFIDSTVVNARNYYISQNANLINSYNMQMELEQTKLNFESLKQKAKSRNITALILSILSLITITTLVVLLKFRKDRNQILRDLVKKNIRLLEEERKLNQSIQENRKYMDKNKVSPTDEVRLKIIYSDLLVWLETDNNFQRNDLNLEMVAKEIGTNRDYLSRAISDHNFRFPDVINKYRIDEVIKILSSPKDKRSRYSLNNIALEVGFNSQSVFIDAFKKQTSMTPGQFRNKVISMEY